LNIIQNFHKEITAFCSKVPSRGYYRKGIGARFSARKTCVVISFLFILPQVKAQNILANPGFEDINLCAEYHADCGIEAWFNIPARPTLVKGIAVPRPVLGHNVLMVPVENIIEKPRNRSTVFTMLCCSLEEGKKYTLRFFLNTSGREFYKLDVLFMERLPDTFGFHPTGAVPSMIIGKEHIIDDYKQGWKVIQFEYTANGDERYMVLGNFSQEKMPYERKDMMNSAGDIFYFIDEISLKPNDQQTTCDEYQKNMELLYAQNLRHTDYVVIKKDTPVAALKPVFITDTLNIPAVFFEVNSSMIKPSYKGALDSLLQKIAGLKLIKMDIFGHTDHTGDPEKNLLLSKNRAAAVKQYFLNAFPQFEGKIFSDGLGASQPIASNASAQGRQQNRRVTVIVTSLETNKKH